MNPCLPYHLAHGSVQVGSFAANCQKDTEPSEPTEIVSSLVDSNRPPVLYAHCAMATQPVRILAIRTAKKNLGK